MGADIAQARHAFFGAVQNKITAQHGDFQGTIFQVFAARGDIPNIAPDAGATDPSSQGDGSSQTSESDSENDSGQTESNPEPQATQEPVAVISAGTPNPEAVGEQVFIDLEGIENESIVEGSQVAFTGTTTPDALVSVNGESIAVDLDGTFSVELSLEPGPNFIEIVSSNLRGQETSRVISVVSIQ